MNPIGKWNWDSTGLPCYDYHGGQPSPALDKSGHEAGLAADPCFILGNYRMTLFVHASGRYQFITGERGWARLNHGAKNEGWNQSLLRAGWSDGSGGRREETYVLTGLEPAHRFCTQRIFGIGYARHVYDLDGELAVTKVISALPSSSVHEGNPSFLTRVTVKNTGSTPVSLCFREEVLARYQMMHDQTVDARRVEYRNELHLDPEHNLVRASVTCHPAKLLLMPESPQESFTHDIAPPTIFLHAADGLGITTAVDTHRSALGDVLAAETAFSLAPGESQTLHYVIGLTFDKGEEAIHRQIAELLTAAGIDDEAGAFVSQWKQALPDFADESDEILRREMLWNAHTLEAMATYSEYFAETYIPQGSVYSYHLGINASNRDHLQHALPLIYTNPPLAKSCIRYAMKHTASDGEIKRQTTGFGYSDPGIYMESDPQLYVFMAAGEYLRVTQDYDLLDETIHYYPVEAGKTTTVVRLLTQHFVYLRDVVGLGKHGLVRMLNSDWSDSFFHPYSPNRHLHWAESHMNSAMVLAVMPRLIRELNQYATHGAGRDATHALAAAMGAYHDDLATAVSADMAGRTFAARCYIGEHDEPCLKFGLEKLCLEAQPFLLQAESFPLERKRQLYQEIRTRVLDPEKFGARTREVPLWSPEGDGEDGGIWFSHQGQLLAGLVTFAPEEANRLLRDLTFHAFAEQYPNYWVGHWTLPDSLNSTLSKREGLYHPWVEAPFQPFCAHAHAWMLYAYCLLRSGRLTS